MGRYFGREPRYSRQEAEAQAKQAIDAAQKKGRPPAGEWSALASRMGDVNRELAARPPVGDIPPPPARPNKTGPPGSGRRRDISQILRPQPAPTPESAAVVAAPAPRARAAAAPKRATKAAAPAAARTRKAAAAPAAGPATVKGATRVTAPATSPDPPSSRSGKTGVAAAERPAAKKRP